MKQSSIANNIQENKVENKKAKQLKSQNKGAN